ncbi:MAG: zinc ribbon domain-containing protein [Candidatus Nanopelagicales bacterium]|nr:zinc ribbon domain-containing protein [Candidatus Nanopelagicales bacterium]
MIKSEAINLPFRYAAGRVGSAYLTSLRDEQRFRATRCSSCLKVLSPARSLCPFCGSPADEAPNVGPNGQISSWTDVPHRGRYALVRLDGADTAMLHRLLGPAEIGARVRPRFANGELEGFEVIG